MFKTPQRPAIHAKPPQPTPRRQRGLTLVEISTTLAIASTLATMGIGSFKETTDQHRLGARATELATDLHYLRTEAVSRNRPLRMSFHEDAGGACYVIQSGPASACECSSQGSAQCEDESAEVLKVVAFPLSGRITLDSNVGSILIDSRLGTASPGGTIRLSDPQQREVRQVVNLMGRVRTCAVSGAVGGHPRC